MALINFQFLWRNHMAKKMIEGGELVPSCNLEVDWTAYDANEIINEQSLFKILKDFLWNSVRRQRV